MNAADRDDLENSAPRTANLPLRALWVVSGVLISAGIACVLTTASAYSTTYGDANVLPIDFALINTISVITPGVVTAGLVCAGLALAAQAMLHRDERIVVVGDVATLNAMEHEHDRQHEYERDVPHADEPATVSPASRPDRERFMRPRAENHEPGD